MYYNQSRNFEHLRTDSSLFLLPAQYGRAFLVRRCMLSDPLFSLSLVRSSTAPLSGSGKTTLLNHILNDTTHGMKFAVIENEFGAVSAWHAAAAAAAPRTFGSAFSGAREKELGERKMHEASHTMHSASVTSSVERVPA